MKKIHTGFRTALMAFTLGLAGVYMSERVPALSGEVHVDLPTALSADIFPVFIDNSRAFTREMNCGKDPADAQARLECTNDQLFSNRDMSLYTRYKIDRHPVGSMGHEAMWENVDDTRVRNIIWRHWKEKTRAHVVVHRLGYHGEHTNHYFIEPASDGTWHLSATYTRSMWLYVMGEGTEVTYVDPQWTYNQHRWKTATADEHYVIPPGTRYLEFENITGDTITF